MTQGFVHWLKERLISIKSLVVDAFRDILKDGIKALLLLLLSSGFFIYRAWDFLKTPLPVPIGILLLAAIVVVTLSIVVVSGFAKARKPRHVTHAEKSSSSAQSAESKVKRVVDKGLGMAWDVRNSAINWLDGDLSHWGSTMFDSVLSDAIDSDSTCLGAIGSSWLPIDGTQMIPSKCKSCGRNIPLNVAGVGPHDRIASWRIKRAALYALQQYYRQHGTFPETVEFDKLPYAHIGN